MQEQHELEERVIGGNETTIDTFPYQVSLRNKGLHFCGGAIISEKHVITGARCIDRGLSVNDLTVSAGSTTPYPENDTEVKAVAYFARHPGYSIYFRKNDIAILFLKTEFTFGQFIQPLKLPQNGVIPEAGSEATLTGWGAVIDNAPTWPTNLRFVSMPVVGAGKCESSYPRKINQGEFCAGGNPGRKNACSGDSGGPLAQNGVLIGVFAFGDKCGLNSRPDVYTRVSHHVEWIVKKITR